MPKFAEELLAIVVDVLEPKRRCFIAFPFALKEPTDKFPITLVIDQAVRQEGSDPQWVDWLPPGDEVMPFIESEIRGASMVIAICSPEKQTGKANPNVMYELGFADALGKPTLMMTNDPKALPFDVAGKNAFTYQEVELLDPTARELLQRRLGAAVAKLKANTSPNDGLVLENLDDVWVLQAQNRLVLKDTFWAYVRNVSVLADNISFEGQHLAVRARKLQELAGTLSYGRARSGQPVLPDFFREWQAYSAGHTHRLMQHLHPQARQSTDHALQKLRQPSGAPADDLITLLDKHYENLCQHISSYSKAFDDANALVERAKNFPGQERSLYGPIDRVTQELESLDHSANSLIKNLRHTINAWFYPRRDREERGTAPSSKGMRLPGTASAPGTAPAASTAIAPSTTVSVTEGRI